ncbi:MAG: hypothetical protein ABW088_08930 [Sedimenticola sp.]
MMKYIDPEDVFKKLEEDRNSGRLRDIVTSANPRYESIKCHPGIIHQIWDDGKQLTGTFHNGILFVLW